MYMLWDKKNYGLFSQRSKPIITASNYIIGVRPITPKRTIPVDEYMRQCEREYLSGHIGVDPADGTIHRIGNIYDQHDLTMHAAKTYLYDRAEQSTCPHCNTAHRASERADNKTRCPWCYKIIA